METVATPGNVVMVKGSDESRVLWSKILLMAVAVMMASAALILAA
jgi:hypothetical protein